MVAEPLILRKAIRFSFSCANSAALMAGMKKAKKKSRSPQKRPSPLKQVEESVSHEKAALRSDAFARALTNAQLNVTDSGHLLSLVEEAAKKAASIPKQPFKDNWPYLQTMLRLVRAHARNEYSPKDDEDDALLWIIAALNYLVDPFDLIPDEAPFIGFVDDATVVEFAVARARSTLDGFMIWETAG